MSTATTTNSRPLIRHLAVTCGDPGPLAKFYTGVFEMELVPGREGDQDFFATDGYFNLALLYQRLFRGESRRGMNHFGYHVESVIDVSERIVALGGREPKPRPSTIPFAEFRGIDPECNGFDLAQKGFLVSKTLRDERALRYASEGVPPSTRPTLRHIGMYVQDPEGVAQFYVDALGMERLPNVEGNTARYVTDGYFTLEFLLYRLEGHGAHGLNHYGFTVKSIAEIAKRITDLGGKEPELRTTAMRPFEVYRAVDPEGNWFNLTEYAASAVQPAAAREPAHA
jgi:catechol 2,3-dioxygenase-like lactoylglutathione lyase family enzyme